MIPGVKTERPLPPNTKTIVSTWKPTYCRGSNSDIRSTTEGGGEMASLKGTVASLLALAW